MKSIELCHKRDDIVKEKLLFIIKIPILLTRFYVLIILKALEILFLDNIQKRRIQFILISPFDIISYTF